MTLIGLVAEGIEGCPGAKFPHSSQRDILCACGCVHGCACLSVISLGCIDNKVDHEKNDNMGCMFLEPSMLARPFSLEPEASYEDVHYSP